MTVRRAVVALAVPAVALVGACGGADGRTALTVLAAASLTDAVADLADAFEASRPDVVVEVSVGASSMLREQILEGAPADVFASADPADAARVVDGGAAEGAPVVVASNRLELVVPEGNPAGVVGLEDLARPDLLVGLCARPVPCGRLARAALDRAGVTPAVDSEALDVRELLTRVAARELDVAVTYRTDAVAAAGSVDGIALEAPGATETQLPIVVLDGAGGGRDAARDFVAFVGSPAGQRILARHGFGPP
jgi:molybdate transport system substrate-binding protein